MTRYLNRLCWCEKAEEPGKKFLLTLPREKRGSQQFSGIFEGEGTDGVDLDGFGTLSSRGFNKGFILKGRNNSLKSTACKANGTDTQSFLVYPNTFTAKDTLIGIECEDGAAVIDGKVSFEPSYR